MEQKLTSKAERTRLQIIEQAAILFNQRGFAGTSMDDIMKATNLSKGALYGNFKNKEEIAVASFLHAVKKVSDKVGERTKVIDNTLDKLKAVVYFYKERILNPPVEGRMSDTKYFAVDADDNNSGITTKSDWMPWIIGRNALAIPWIQGKARGDEVTTRSQMSQEFAVRFIGVLEGGIMLAQVYKDVKYFNIMTIHLLEMIEST